jgi:hypothetical protein
MSRWYLAALFSMAALAAPAYAQTGNDVHSGLGSNAGTIQGGNINDVNGINANGTPKSQSPGASMTVGAGNSTMIPGVAGGPATPPLSTLTNPPAGIAIPTINGAAPPPPPVPPAGSTP